jgi:hypothetical protein
MSWSINPMADNRISNHYSKLSRQLWIMMMRWRLRAFDVLLTAPHHGSHDIENLRLWAKSGGRLNSGLNGARCEGDSLNTVSGEFVWTARCLERKCLWLMESPKKAEILQLIKQHQHPHSCEVHQRRVFRPKNQNNL